MNIHIDAIEGLWIIVNIVAFVFTAKAIIDARVDLYITRAENVTDNLIESAREVAAWGLLRRESLRLMLQLGFLSLVIPGIFTERPIVLSFFLVVLIAMPCILLVQTLLDHRDKVRLANIMSRVAETDRLLAEQAYRDAIAREISVQQNIVETKQVGESITNGGVAINGRLDALTDLVNEGIGASRAAQEEANHANRKLASLTEALARKEDKEDKS